MATQILTRVLCDFCNADDIETSDARTESVTIGGAEYEIDVCEPHGKPLTELAETLAALGRKLPKTATERARVKPSRLTEPGAHVCPSCGKAMNHRSSLTSHARSVHKTTLAELEGLAVPFKCSRCERAFSTAQGAAVHDSRSHGPKTGSDTPSN